MSDLLKSVIQDLINDRTEQAQVSIHQYIVAKTQEVAGLSEADESKLRTFKVSVRFPNPGKDTIEGVAKSLLPKGATLVSSETDEPEEEGSPEEFGEFVFTIKCGKRAASDIYDKLKSSGDTLSVRES